MKKSERYYGEFGGQFVSESLMNVLDELDVAFEEAIHDEAFLGECALLEKPTITSVIGSTHRAARAICQS